MFDRGPRRRSALLAVLVVGLSWRRWQQRTVAVGLVESRPPHTHIRRDGAALLVRAAADAGRPLGGHHGRALLSESGARQPALRDQLRRRQVHHVPHQHERSSGRRQRLNQQQQQRRYTGDRQRHAHRVHAHQLRGREADLLRPVRGRVAHLGAHHIAGPHGAHLFAQGRQKAAPIPRLAQRGRLLAAHGHGPRVHHARHQLLGQVRLLI